MRAAARRNLHRIDYRHVIWSLVRKPGAFARYVYREELFPSLVFRAAYDAIQTAQPGTKGDLEYLRILHLAASTMEADVEPRSRCCSTSGKPITADAVKRARRAPTPVDVPALASPPVDLAAYDALLARRWRHDGASPNLAARGARASCCARSSCRRSRGTPRRSRKSRARRLDLRPVPPPPRRARGPRAPPPAHRAQPAPVGSAADKTLATLKRSRLPPKVAKMLPTLCEGGFVERGDNLLAFGLPGRGKTHLVCAIGHELIQRGYRVLFTRPSRSCSACSPPSATSGSRRSSRSSTASTR